MSTRPSEGGVRAEHVQVVRTARYFAVGDPAHAREVWLVLHGYGQLARYFLRHFMPHVAARLVVAPEALNRFYLESRDDTRGAVGGVAAPVHSPRVGATWMTREDRDADIADYVRALDLVLDASARGVPADAPLTVLGFSQGATTAVRWIADRARRGLRAPARLVLWQGELPHDVDVGAIGAHLADTALTLVTAADDPYFTPAAASRTLARLDAAGLSYEQLTFEGGHRMDGATLEAMMRSVSAEPA